MPQPGRGDPRPAHHHHPTSGPAPTGRPPLPGQPSTTRARRRRGRGAPRPTRDPGACMRGAPARGPARRAAGCGRRESVDERAGSRLGRPPWGACPCVRRGLCGRPHARRLPCAETGATSHPTVASKPPSPAARPRCTCRPTGSRAAPGSPEEAAPRVPATSAESEAAAAPGRALASRCAKSARPRPGLRSRRPAPRALRPAQRHAPSLPRPTPRPTT